MESRDIIAVISLIVTAFSAYIFFLHRQFGRERSDYATEREKRNTEWQSIAKDSNQVLREHTNVLAGLKTLLENNKRR